MLDMPGHGESSFDPKLDYSPLGMAEKVHMVCTCIYNIHVHVLMRDEKEERRKQARSNKQTRQSNTAHTRKSFFLRKISCLGWDSNPRHMYDCIT